MSVTAITLRLVYLAPRARREAPRGIRPDRAEAVAVPHPAGAPGTAAPLRGRGAIRRAAGAARRRSGAGGVDLVRAPARAPRAGLGGAGVRPLPRPAAAVGVAGDPAAAGSGGVRAPGRVTPGAGLRGDDLRRCAACRGGPVRGGGGRRGHRRAARGGVLLARHGPGPRLRAGPGDRRGGAPAGAAPGYRGPAGRKPGHSRPARPRNAAVHLARPGPLADLADAAGRTARAAGGRRRRVRGRGGGAVIVGMVGGPPAAPGHGGGGPRRSGGAQRLGHPAPAGRGGRAGAGAAPGRAAGGGRGGPVRAVPARWSARSPPASRGARSPSAPAWASPAPRWRDTLRARMNERSFSREDRMIAPPFTAEHELFRKTLRDYVVRELAPHALEWDEAGIFPREVFRQLAELGALGVNYPEEVGGSGGDFWHAVVLAEELVHSRNSGVNMAVLVQSQIATPIIQEIGTAEQKKEFLAPALAGEKIAALGISEPDAGSDVAHLRTTARRSGDDYVIDGAKMWITNGTRADFITLAVRTGGPGYGGISLVTFPTDVKGFSVSKKLQKLGNLSSDTALLFFEDCRIPARYLLGEENQGFYHVMTNFQGERLVAAIGAVAGMQQMVDDAIQYGNERGAFGKPLIKFQVWKHKLVEHLTAIEAARWLTYRACDLFNRKEAAVKEISMAKLFACDLIQRVVYDCQQFHGGMGYVLETPVARAFRDARLLTIGGGASEIMKEIISQLVPGF